MNLLNSVSNFWGRLASSSLCDLTELLGEKVPLPDIDLSRKDRIFNSWRTFWLFLGQVLSVNQTCREALRKAQVWFFVADVERNTNTRANGTEKKKEKEKEKEKEKNKKKHLIQHFCLLPGSQQA